jgi:hypothetical protein
MKIHDIISEKPIQEGAFDSLLKIAGKTGGKLLAHPGAIDAAKSAAGKVASSLGHDVKDAGGIVNAYKNIGSTIARPVTAVANITGKVAMVIKFFGLYQMFMDYNAAVKRAEADLKAKKITPEQYKNDIKQQKAILVAQLVIALPGFLLAKIGSNWSLWTIGFKYSRNPLGVAIGTIMATAAVSTQAALIQLLRTDTAANWYAQAIAGTFIGDLSQEVYDRVADLFKTAEQKANGQSGNPNSPDAKADKDATSSTPGTAPANSTKSTPVEPRAAYDQSIKDKFKGIN